MDNKPKTTLSGKPPEAESPGAPVPINSDTGQHKDHWILPEEERAKGFIRPVRLQYVHDRCGGLTSMPQAIAETYARDPSYYGSTFCISCKKYFPVKEFLWDSTNERVGS